MTDGLTGRRHVLVVAPQCASMQRLTRLEEAAAGLYSVLTDPSLGSCEPGLPDGRGGLVSGDGLTSGIVRAAVDEAVRHAAERQAALVLAFLGHGFAPGRSSTLHLMCADSTEDLRHDSVNVSDLLAVAVDHPAVDGVLGIVDTCHAAGAPPPAGELAGGTRNGRTRLGLLMASSLGQAAVDLAFSRQLAGLVRAGLSGAGPTLAVADVRDALRTVLVGQNVTGFDFDGDGSARAPLWVARNARVREGLLGGFGGRLASEELTEALAAVDPAMPVPDSAPDLRAARRCREDLLGRPSGEGRTRALRAVDGLLVAVRTVEFVRSWIGGGLTTTRIRHALHTMLAAEGRLPAGDAHLTDVAVIDELTFNHPATDPDGRRAVARFVVLLGQVCGKDLQDRELHAWAELIEAPVEVNDAIEHADRRMRGRRLSLVVSLHSSLTGDWPEVLDGWLLLDGAMVHHEQFPSETADRRGAEGAVEEAVLWAEEHARTLDLPLERLDLAVPGGLLLAWRPEEAGVALLLGVRYEVRLHWSSRLTPDTVLRSIEPVVSARWESISRCKAGTPVDWLVHEDLADPHVLRGHLRNGRYARGIGLTQHPGADARLLEMLLAYTPVLLWPHVPGGFPLERHDCLDRSWWAMPGALAHAYRDRWRGVAGADLADLRAVWDDEDWLRFCRFFRTATPPARTRDEGTS
uniref:vWA-MoxR associated protein middle region 2 domain-containing protein n=1 Tax=Streptomyces sp. NBC_00049 TaxID=2903617 RepID=A0AAU2JIJ3_9ACTN